MKTQLKKILQAYYGGGSFQLSHKQRVVKTYQHILLDNPGYDKLIENAILGFNNTQDVLEGIGIVRSHVSYKLRKSEDKELWKLLYIELTNVEVDILINGLENV